MSNVEEVKSFVSNKLKSLRDEHRLLEIHICACEAISEANKNVNERLSLEHALLTDEAATSLEQIADAIDAHIMRQHEPWRILQLLCLWSVARGGIVSKHFEALTTRFLHAYGYRFLPTLFNFRHHGLLVEQTSAAATISSSSPSITSPAQSTSSTPILLRRSTSRAGKNAATIINSNSSKHPNFKQLSRTLNLIPKPAEKTTSSSASYVFSDAYVPVVCRLLEMLVNDGWQPTLLAKAFGADMPLVGSDLNAPKPDNRIRKAILVCFLDGVTYAEIGAVRRFAQDHNFRIIILTTHIIYRQSYIKSFTEII